MVSRVMTRPMAVKPLPISTVNLALQIVLAFGPGPGGFEGFPAVLVVVMTIRTAGLHLACWL